MSGSLSTRKRAGLVGGLILLAYAMLTYTITGNRPLGIATDLLAGGAVIAIPLLMRPLFGGAGNSGLNTAYMAARFIEGGLMILGGLVLFSPAAEGVRTVIYEKVHIWFFILGALLFYLLLHRTRIVPRYISVWGGVAAVALLLMTLLGLAGVTSPLLGVLVLPIVLNEIFLAVWLMIKGFAEVPA